MMHILLSRTIKRTDHSKGLPTMTPATSTVVQYSEHMEYPLLMHPPKRALLRLAEFKDPNGHSPHCH